MSGPPRSLTNIRTMAGKSRQNASAEEQALQLVPLMVKKARLEREHKAMKQRLDEIESQLAEITSECSDIMEALDRKGLGRRRDHGETTDSEAASDDDGFPVSY